MAKIVVAIQGILDPALDKYYFPPDLPLDWKLAYLANDHQACLLSARDIIRLKIDPDDSLPEDFRIYVAVDDNEPPEIPPAIEKNIAGFYLRDNTGAGHLVTANYFAIRMDGESGLKISKSGARKLPPCHSDGSGTDLHCAFVSEYEISDLRSFKEQLLNWISESVDERVVFIASGTNIESIKRMEELVRLLS